jgi:hypothetical protein
MWMVSAVSGTGSSTAGPRPPGRICDINAFMSMAPWLANFWRSVAYLTYAYPVMSRCLSSKIADAPNPTILSGLFLCASSLSESRMVRAKFELCRAFAGFFKN